MSLQTSQISSIDNPQFKIWKSLLNAKGIKEHGQFLLMGKKLVEEFLLSPHPHFKIQTLLCIEKKSEYPQIRQTLLSKNLFEELDILGTHSDLLVLSFDQFETSDFEKSPMGLEIVTPLGDPKNLGALTRTALAFGVQTIHLTKESTHPFLPQSVKASAGAVLKIKFFKSQKMLSETPVVGDNYALDLQGQNITQLKWPQNMRLWVGEEGPGLKLNATQSRQIKLIRIATQNVESLNATVSASLAIWEWKKSQN